MTMVLPSFADLWTGPTAYAQTFAAGLDPAGLGHAQQQARLAALLGACVRSPFYQRRLRGTGRSAPRLADCEPVTKSELMNGFDDWCTDRAITRRSVEAFVADPARLAQPYLGRYCVWTSSGTSGVPGIFVQDAQCLAAYDALDLLRLRGGPQAWWPIAAWGLGQRFAFVAATGGHFAGVVAMQRQRRLAWSTESHAVGIFSIQQPWPSLMRSLQAHEPTVLITYPSAAAALAEQQARGALKLRLAEVWLGGEQLTAAQRQQIGAAFGCPLRNNYGASEFFSIAWECARGRLHLNSDWLILEPVDQRLQPVAAGVPSHAVLLTNLANRTQPLLRYRLDDSVCMAPARCACGSAFAAIEVQGRAEQSLCLRNGRGGEVVLLPLALMTVIEEGAGVTQFQLLQTGSASLQVRFESTESGGANAFVRVRRALEGFLATQGLRGIEIRHSRAAPQRHARSGKLSRVVKLSAP